MSIGARSTSESSTMLERTEHSGVCFLTRGLVILEEEIFAMVSLFFFQSTSPAFKCKIIQDPVVTPLPSR